MITEIKNSIKYEFKPKNILALNKKNILNNFAVNTANLREEIFAEEIFANLAPFREIKFRETRQNWTFAKINSAKYVKITNRENKFLEFFIFIFLFIYKQSQTR